LLSTKKTQLTGPSNPAKTRLGHALGFLTALRECHGKKKLRAFSNSGFLTALRECHGKKKLRAFSNSGFKTRHKNEGEKVAEGVQLKTINTLPEMPNELQQFVLFMLKMHSDGIRSKHKSVEVFE
jgi:hypothetical protein